MSFSTKKSYQSSYRITELDIFECSFWISKIQLNLIVLFPFELVLQESTRNKQIFAIKQIWLKASAQQEVFIQEVPRIHGM